jgi:uncharacterized heparinase superfamily protein
MDHASASTSPMQRLGLYWHTCIRLPKAQLLRRLEHAAWTPRAPSDLRASMRRMPSIKAPIHRPRSWGHDGSVTFIGIDGRCDSPESWQARRHGLLWNFNLHYFEDLLARDAGSRIGFHQALLHRWVRENPPATGTGWLPYPCSLRISNWIKWHLSGGDLDDELARSLATQAEWLGKRCEHHLRGNHLFVNAKALCMAGLAIDCARSNRWLERGLKILRTEVPAQVLTDGGHCERSPMYHSLVLEDVLDMLNLASAAGLPDRHPLVTLLRPCVAPMLGWLGSMCHPDGNFAFFNDCALGIAPTLDQLEQYAERVTGKANGIRERGTRQLAASGFTRLVSEPWTVLVDTGSAGPKEQPAHAHAGTLSLEASLLGHRLFVNSGTSTYAPGDARLHERGTAAHTCVQIGQSDSSQVWASFRMGRRARVTATELALSADGSRSVDATHDGYAHRPGRPLVRRRVTVDDRTLRIQDWAGPSPDGAVSRFHLHPDVTATGSDVIRLELPGGMVAVLRHNARSVRIVGGEWRPRFGTRTANRSIELALPPDGLDVKVEAQGQPER